MLFPRINMFPSQSTEMFISQAITVATLHRLFINGVTCPSTALFDVERLHASRLMSQIKEGLFSAFARVRDSSKLQQRNRGIMEKKGER